MELEEFENYQGIVVDIFASMPPAQQPEINVVEYSRNRGERALYAGEIDFTILSREWLQQPDALIYTQPIYIHKEYLFATSPIANLPVAALLKGKTVCTRRGYVYPSITQFFDENIAIRIDSHEEKTQFAMLMKKRCNFVITNQFVGQEIIFSSGWQQQIFKTPYSVDQVD